MRDDVISDVVQDDVISDVVRDDVISDVVRDDVISAEALHAKHVDVCVELRTEHVNWEAISFAGAEGERIEAALKTSCPDLRVPVLAALLVDELLGDGSVDGYPLCRGSKLVLVTCDLELPGISVFLLSFPNG